LLTKPNTKAAKANTITATNLRTGLKPNDPDLIAGLLLNHQTRVAFFFPIGIE
jgi:hypothetical protein